MNGDTSDREDRIRVRAHQLWQEAGEPEGRDEEFWHLAVALVDAQNQGGTGSKPVR